MKQLCLALSIMMVLFICGCGVQTSQPAQEEQEVYFLFSIPDWVEWGMKEGEVRQHLSTKTVVGFDDFILYSEDAWYEDCYEWDVFFGFSRQNELVYVKHSLTDEIFDFENNKYNQTFLELLDKMKNKYGEPMSDDEKWHDEKYKDDEYMINKAIDDGDYTREVKWNLDGYFCSLILDEGISIFYSE